jgi:hypothetical protein
MFFRKSILLLPFSSAAYGGWVGGGQGRYLTKLGLIKEVDHDGSRSMGEDYAALWQDQA